MQNEEPTLDAQEEYQESETVVLEDSTPEQSEEESQSETDNSFEARLAKAEAEAAKFRRLFEKVTKPKETKAPQPASSASIEETVLLANGLPEELLGELKAVAAVRKVSLIKAQNDPIFVAVKEKFEKDQRRDDASLPAARGSGSVKPKKDSTTPGLTREEHMAIFNAANR